MDLYCTKSQYRIQEDVVFRLESWKKGNANILVFSCETKVFSMCAPYQPSGYITIGSFPSGGYGVIVTVDGHSLSTAFDVCERSEEYPRYGFLSDFGENELDDSDVFFLNLCHINFVQFYDWMYRHHDLIPKQRLFDDPLGRKLCVDTIKNKISACKERGMRSIAYGAIYGAEDEYTSVHPEQVMLKKDGSFYNLLTFIHMMDFGVDRPWSDHIINEFRKACEFGFDGIHMDQYGFPKFSFRESISYKNIFDVENAFYPFIQKVRAAFGEKVTLFFNSVNNWPMRKVASASVDAVYIEVWAPHDSYAHLERLVLDAKLYGNHKPVILAAYLKPFSKNRGIADPRAESCFRLTFAAISASGGNMLVIGENKGILQDAYYPDYGLCTDSFASVIRRFFDYIVRYRDFLYDEELELVSMEYCGGVNGDLYADNSVLSADARPGTVWASVRKKKGLMMINLINLTNQENSIWNENKQECKQIKGLVLMLTCEDIEEAYIMSPDCEDISMRKINFDETENFAGKGYKIVVDSLKYWDTLIIRERVDIDEKIY